MPLDCTLVDVFTAVPLEGNQLAVFTDAADIAEATLQPLAREIGFSETVYIYAPTAGGDARIRIFTPDDELPFAGHPVLGTARVLAELRGLDAITLETGAGLVPVTVNGTRGSMKQPIPSVAPFEGDADALLAALGVARSEAPIEVYDIGIRHLYVTLPDTETVAALRPDVSRLDDICHGIGTNCIAGGGAQWKTRMFFPGAGVAEDAATGSAAGPLAVHVARHGFAPWGTQLTISQGAEIDRPSTLYAVARGSDGAIDEVEVAGDAVIVGRSEFIRV